MNTAWHCGRATLLAAVALTACAAAQADGRAVWHCRAGGVELLVGGGPPPASQHCEPARDALLLQPSAAPQRGTLAPPRSQRAAAAADDAQRLAEVIAPARQAALDADRRRVLEDELQRARAEMQRLSGALAGATAEQTLQRQRTAEDITALQRELARF